MGKLAWFAIGVAVGAALLYAAQEHERQAAEDRAVARKVTRQKMGKASLHTSDEVARELWGDDDGD